MAGILRFLALSAAVCTRLDHGGDMRQKILDEKF
jgi:hypothetical protein